MSMVLVAGARTAIGAMGGAFKDVADHELAVVAIGEAVRRAGIDISTVDEYIHGQVIAAGQAAYNARRVSLAAGMKVSTPSFAVNKLCGSGMRASYSAFSSLVTGENQVVVAGGTENMTQAPYLLPNGRYGSKLGHTVLLDSLTGALTCGVTTLPMGITAENIAERYGITRAEQDEFAVRSNNLAVQAQKSGRFEREIVGVETKKGLITQDERPAEATLEAFGKLRPVFKKDGTITAANASGINDGACFMVFTTEEYAKAHGLPVLAKVHGFASAGVEPEVMGLGPSAAIPKLLARHGKSLSDMDLIEVNEAFAVQALGVAKDLNIPMDKYNVNGGAVALGHPIGMSGARVLLTLAYELQERKQQWGVASLCIGGGQGIACLIESV